MAKAILVIDMPSRCDECKLHYKDMQGCYCNVNDEEVKNWKKPSWCPLKPLPKPITEYDVKVAFNYDADYAEGWNDCIDEILGEQNANN